MFLPGNNVFPWKYTQPLHHFLPAQSCSSLNWKTIKLNYTFISQLFEGFLPPFWRLPPNFLKASSKLSEGFLPTLWMPLPNFLKAFSHLSEDFLPTFWRLPPNFVKASSQLSEGFLPTFWRLSPNFLKASSQLCGEISSVDSDRALEPEGCRLLDAQQGLRT